MITSKKTDGTYGEIGFIKVKQEDGSYKDIEYQYDNKGNLIFEKGFTRSKEGVLPLVINGIGKPLKDYDIEGNTYQSDGVSPDTPQEVVGCGDRTGNLLKLTDDYVADIRGVSVSIKNGTLSIKGTADSSGGRNIYLSEAFTLKAGTYILSGTAVSGLRYCLSKVADGSAITATYGQAMVTLTEDAIVAFGLNFIEGTTYDATVNVMLNTGSTPLPYEPYRYKVDVETKGKNLFPLDSTKLHVGRIENDGTIGYEIGTITVDTNSVTYQANTTWRGFYTDYITVVGNDKLTFSPNRSSTISIALACYDKDNRFLGKATSTSSANSKTFTLINDTTKVRVNIASSDTQYTITNPMLETGSTATEYSPYIEPITTPIYLDSPLYKIGDYSDSRGMIDEVRAIKELVLTGEEGWTKSSTYKGSFYAKCLADIRFPFGDAYCSHAIQAKTLSTYTYGNFYLENNVGDHILNLFIGQPEWTVDDFKAYLKERYNNGTPIKVYYVLATPKTKGVESMNIPTLNETTVINIDTEVKPSNMWVEYKSSTSEYNPITLRTIDNQVLYTADNEILQTRR